MRLTRLMAITLPISLASCAMQVSDDEVGFAEEELVLLARPTLGGSRLVAAPVGVTVESGCDRRRMMGQPLLSRVCPAPSGDWTLSEGLDGIRDRSGDRFCLYEFTGWRYSQAGLPTDRDPDDDVHFRSPSVWLEADCRAVVGLGATDDALESMAQEHQDAFLEHIASVASLPEIPTWSTLEGYPRTTEVAVLDSSEDSAPGDVEPRSGDWLHGRSVGLAIRNVVCPEGRGGACPLDVTNYDVLELDSPQGGSYGHVGALAVAIKDAVDHAEGNLVINLSVGWHPTSAYRTRSGEISVFKTQTLAVEAALNYARCHGALVIAAAGNTDDGPGVDATSLAADPMFPARLSTESGWACGTRSADLAQQLVYPISAVGPGDEDVANSRERAVAELAGPGHAVTFDNTQGNIDGDTRAIPLGTGSSFGAASASAVAALVWAYRPDLRPAQVMEIVRATAVDLGRSADFCDGGRSRCNVRRVSACNAVKRAYREACQSNWYYRNYGWYFCPDVVDCETPGAGTPEGPGGSHFDAMLELAGARRVRFDATTSTCDGAGSFMTDGDLSQSYCPDEELANGIATPDAVSTQPGDDLCGACAIGVSGGFTTVVIGLDPSPGATVTSPVLNYGGVSYGLSSTLSYAYGGNMVSFQLPSSSYSSTATLSYEVSGSQSITSVLPVYGF